MWNHAVQYADEVIEACEHLATDRKHYRLIEQLEAASTSIAMNIAEGKGRSGRKEFVRFLGYSRGSLNEVVTLLEIFRRRQWMDAETFGALDASAVSLGKQINALISRLSKDQED